MRKIMLFLLFITWAFSSHSQKHEYAGKYIGWMKMFNPNEPQKPYTVDHHKYSVKQMGISQMLVSWVQQSYTPKGGLGRAFRLVNNKIGLYTPEEKPKPHIYGTTTKTFIELKKNPTGQWIPETGTSWFMEIAVNGEIGDYTDVITTGEKYFFHIPGDKGLEPHEQQVANLMGFSSHQALKKYISWYQPKGIRTTLQYVVLLCKDNVKPYLQLTKGEYLDELGKAIERDAVKTYKWIAEEKAKNSRYNASITEKEIEDRKAAFVRLKEKYKNRLNEPAKLRIQPDFRIEYEGSFDVFENPNYPSEYPVYKFDPAKLALTKSDSPQWIVIRWDAEGVANGDEAGTHLHQSMLENIDYDYIYNYFFYPEKVKGIPYKPLKAPGTDEKAVVLEMKDIAHKDNSRLNADDCLFTKIKTIND